MYVFDAQSICSSSHDLGIVIVDGPTTVLLTFDTGTCDSLT